MSEVVVSKTISSPVEKVWNALSSFRGIENYSPIVRSETTGEGAGAKRVCELPDGALIYEELNFVQDDSMQMEYKINEGPFPVEGYVSTIKVSPAESGGSRVTWGCEFSSAAEVEAEMKELFGGFYHVIIDSLEGYLNN